MDRKKKADGLWKPVRPKNEGTRPTEARRSSSLLKPTNQEPIRPVSMAGDVEESLLQCSICLESFTIPKALPCLHVFCLECLEKILATAIAQNPMKRNEIQCPQCRATHRLPKEGVRGLPTSHTINSLLDITEKHRRKSVKDDSDNQTQDGRVVCSICSAAGSSVPATRFCFTCASARCTKCTTIHDRNSLHSSHASVDISDEKVDAIMCQDHPAQCVVRFCRTCSRPVCNLCIHQDHSEHAHAAFAAFPRDAHKEYQKAEGLLKAAKSKLSQQRSKCDDSKRTNDATLRNFKIRVNRHFDEQVKLLQEQKEKVLDESDRLYVNIDGQITHTDALLVKVARSLTEQEQELRHMISPLPGHNAIALDRAMPVDVITKLLDEIETTSSRSCAGASFKFVPGPASSLGEIENQDTGSDISRVSLEVVRDTCVKWQEHDGIQYITDICLLNDNTIICVSGIWPDKIFHCMDLNGKKKHLPSYLVKHSQGALKLATNGVHTAFLKKSAQEESSLTLLRKQNHVSTFPCKAYCQPRAIAVTNNGEIIMAAIDKHLLCCYSQKGEILWERNTSPDTDLGGYQLPITMITDRYNRVIVADMPGHKLHIYTGILFNRSFPSKTCSNVNPVGICLADDNSFFVAFGKPMFTVSKFDSNGQFIKHIVRMSFEPTKIQYIAEAGLLVVGTWGQGVVAYRMDQLT